MAGRPRPICAKCTREMRVTENEKSVHDPESGGFPSTYWSGDEYECPGCGCRIVTGFGIGTSKPIPRRHESPASATEGSLEFSEPSDGVRR